MDPDRSHRVRGRGSLENAAAWLVVWGGLPALITSLVLLWTGEYGVEVRWTLTVVLPTVWLGCAVAAHGRVSRPMNLLSNLLGALREGDYSLRGAGARWGHSLGAVMQEVNLLGETLHRQRLSAVEATALLSRVMAEIDVAVFAFDADDQLRLVNRAGAELMKQSAADLMGKAAYELGLEGYLRGQMRRVLDREFPGGRGRWELRRSVFRQDGRPHRLLVLADLSIALREEERQAWQRIVRVLSHEINNSLTPIQSIARSVRRILDREFTGNGRAEEMREGLAVIASRAESLGRLMSEYAQLARMPRPTLRPVSVRELVTGVIELEQRSQVELHPSPDVVVRADRDQLEQVLINLVRNAADAVQDTAGGVTVGWTANDEFLDVVVDDEGTGIDETANLFVPFYTTKPRGSGIGLALSRQIAEAHGGTLTLENHRDRRGARARLRLPLAPD